MKNRKSTLEKPKVLVDTTFLLPAIGFEVEEEAMEVIPLFRKLDVYYLEIALLEAMWKAVKVIDTGDIDIVREGIEAIRNTYKLVTPPPIAFVNAMKIYHGGHRDLIDALHYETARALDIPWLTIDIEFIEFLKKRNLPVDKIVLTPSELKGLV
ncbi:PIN domain-containing protein [Thermogladius sp. 4427co]|uniref:PIN domain-containing protein n=1 Tax=Thermogladius sp. 4427co TaxID=3450718 RepID=UPI003F7A02B8